MKMLGLVKELQDNSTGVKVEESDSGEYEEVEVELETSIFEEEEYYVDPSTTGVYDSELELVGRRVWKDGRWTLERSE